MSSPAIGLPFQEAFEQFWINPRTSWERFFNPQIFVSLNRGDAAVENHVLGRAGSYGKQLGRVLDALDVLVARLPAEGLTPRERRAVDALRELSRTVDAALDEYGRPRATEPTLADVDRLLGGLEDLKRSDPAGHRALLDRLRRGVAEADGRG
ncbi:MAG TPA: hypothetical protein VFX28_11975 [Methylomirabilota bacterium]|nr:hypothetical protein [Methylomirabilota bacterium]